MSVRAMIEAGFAVFANRISRWAGSPLVFAAALSSVLAWALFGPYARFSESWQMVINTGTTICTFLMVFIIQNSQNRDGLAVQIKLDEIIRAVHGAKNSMIDLEDMPQEELEKLRVSFAAVGHKARRSPVKRNRT